MIGENLNNLMTELNNNNVIVSFNGSFTQGIIEQMGEAIKSYLNNDKPEDETRIYDVFSVYIEQSQNIKNYFLMNSDKYGFGLKSVNKIVFESNIIIGREGDGYYVCSSNLIENSDMEDLKNRIDLVNTLSKEQLRKLYKQKLRDPKSEGCGAGLGIINIARKSAVKLEYSFSKKNEHYSLYSLKVML